MLQLVVFHVAGLSGLVVAQIVGITLLFLTSIFEHMPLNAMAAIIIMGVVGLLDFKRAVFYSKVRAKLEKSQSVIPMMSSR